MRKSHSVKAANVLGVAIDAVDMDQALQRVSALLASGLRAYVCVAGVHGVMEAQRQPELSRSYRGAAMVVPDGMPLVWVGRWQGFAAMRRVTGPDVMLEVMTRPEFSHYSHFFYGGVAGVAEELKQCFLERNPQARIVGVKTPPFHSLSRSEEDELIDEVARLAPDVFWVGIGCPKQELFMARMLGKLDTKLMVGVGAAFDYHTGRIRDCAEWVKRAGLQWLHRLMQDPRRLWRRYLRNNPEFIVRIALQFAGVPSPAARRAMHAGDTSHAI